MLPSPMELTYFSEIADSLNLSRTSKRLGVSQPSLSLALKRLEHTLGQQLFIRHKQGVTLTPAGEKLLLQVKPLLQHWENTKIDVRDSHQQIQGRVTIGCRSATALHMCGFLKEILAAHPNLEVNFKFQNSQKISEGVINSSIDIGIVASPQQHYDLVVQKLDDMEMSFWVSNNSCELQDITSGRAVIICEPNTPHVQRLLRTLSKENFRVSRIIAMNNLEVVAHFTIEGCGIGILPTCFGQLLYSDKLKRLENMPTESSEVSLIYRHENKNVAAIKTVIQAIKDFNEQQ